MPEWSACVECSRATHPRTKYAGPCSVCGATTCPKHSYFYTDESNAAVTAAARPTCLIHRDRYPGILSADNLLSSGDFAHRTTARARFTVTLTAFGSRLAFATPEGNKE